MRQCQRRRQHGDRQWAENTLYIQVSNERLANAFWETLLNYSTHLNISTAHFKSYMNIHYLYVCTHIVLIICPNVLRCRYIKVMQVFLGICLKQVFIWQHFRVRLFFFFSWNIQIMRACRNVYTKQKQRDSRGHRLGIDRCLFDMDRRIGVEPGRIGGLFSTSHQIWKVIC